MTSALLSNFFQLQLETSDPEEKFLTSGVTWKAYESLLASLGNTSSYRVAYLLGTLEIMSPSRSHELDKKAIARLLEVYLEENRLRFWGLGSTCFEYEWHDDGGSWYRAYGNENWEFADNGLMRRREASINDLPIQESARKFLWARK
ncbi:MAG: hypothetical protein RLZZ381_523 [Cyanobacteriota bacterium]|jgi:alpha-amylase/alpha-mannosidase (GH57 family)